jgi:diguanylate cyclase (GGDEF)-like protein
MTDWLTRALNRHGIESAILEAMALSERYGHTLSVALLDIDHFKAINDTYGHEAGDRVLVALAEVLSHGVRAPDKVGRYGGEEFLLVFPETDLESARTLVERIRSRVGATPFDVGPKEIGLTVSAGVSQFRPGETLRALTRRVDHAMYEAKRSGRDAVVSL